MRECESWLCAVCLAALGYWATWSAGVRHNASGRRVYCRLGVHVIADFRAKTNLCWRVDSWVTNYQVGVGAVYTHNVRLLPY